MGPYVHPSFALFCLENLSVKTINDILPNAHDGSTVDQWYFYLATSDYAFAPQKPESGGGQEGTEAPIDITFKSPFVGQSVAAVAEWLKRKPKSVDLENRFIAVLDKKAGMGSVALCRIGGRDLQGDALSCEGGGILFDAGRNGVWGLGGLGARSWRVHAPKYRFAADCALWSACQPGRTQPLLGVTPRFNIRRCNIYIGLILGKPPNPC